MLPVGTTAGVARRRRHRACAGRNSTRLTVPRLAANAGKGRLRTDTAGFIYSHVIACTPVVSSYLTVIEDSSHVMKSESTVIYSCTAVCTEVLA